VYNITLNLSAYVTTSSRKICYLNRRKLQQGTRAVHNRAASCVAAGGGIFENQV